MDQRSYKSPQRDNKDNQSMNSDRGQGEGSGRGKGLASGSARRRANLFNPLPESSQRNMEKMSRFGREVDPRNGGSSTDQSHQRRELDVCNHAGPSNRPNSDQIMRGQAIYEGQRPTLEQLEQQTIEHLKLNKQCAIAQKKLEILDKKRAILEKKHKWLYKYLQEDTKLAIVCKENLKLLISNLTKNVDLLEKIYQHEMEHETKEEKRLKLENKYKEEQLNLERKFRSVKSIHGQIDKNIQKVNKAIEENKKEYLIQENNLKSKKEEQRTLSEKLGWTAEPHVKQEELENYRRVLARNYQLSILKAVNPKM